MFDRLIVSEPAGAHIRSRRNYFLVSTVAVGTLLLTAVVFSIFAEELSLGTESFELTVLALPVDMPATQPEPPRPRQPATNTSNVSASQLPMRQVNQARTDEPTIVPATISTAANTQVSRPDVTRFEIGPRNSDPGVPSGTGRNTGPTGNGPGGGLSIATQVAEHTPDTEPPPARTPPRVPAVVSGGVVNGQASYLPKPAYPPPAIAVHAEGKVDVQVLIDETGHVVSAKAISGNPLLRGAAENAARNARFTPTLLSRVPVKVTGVIVYNFTRS
jgi:TonB family protein